MSENLPTAAEVSRMPQELKAKIAARSRQKGSNYERTVAKRIAGYFGISDWKEVAFRTAPHGHRQVAGDLKLINEVGRIWKSAGLGVVELKNRKEWSFDQLFKIPEKSLLFEYWAKSNVDTNTTNSIVIFTKNGVTDYVLHLNDNKYCGTIICVQAFKNEFIIQTLKSFLISHFPEPQSLL